MNSLRALRRGRLDYGGSSAERKLNWLGALDSVELPSARAVHQLHEALLFLRGYPDDERVLRAAESMLARFSRRRDLLRFRDALIDSGIAGTAMRYPFFHPTARWLARRFPGALTIDWESFSADDLAELDRLLILVASPAELPWLQERSPGARLALLRLSRRRETDAETLLDRLDALAVDPLLREALHDRAAPFYQLACRRGTPNRTTAQAAGAPIAYFIAPPARSRPDLRQEIDRPPLDIRDVPRRDAVALIELARDAMVTRSRDLDCFCHADPRDVRRIAHEAGLEFVAFGSLPERRLPLAAAYGLLTLRNGVPTGYVQLDAFLDTALVHFNTFDTYRGADAAWVFARALATARALFGVSAFAIEPYQLGHGNAEAIESGAFWFYEKLGFVPLDRRRRTLVRREKDRFARRPGARSTPATLLELADGYLVFEPFGVPAAIAPHAAVARVAIAQRAKTAPDEAKRLAARLAAELEFRPRTAAERLWIERWAPWLAALPLARWRAAERAGVAAIVRAKAARREAELWPLALRHPRFVTALRKLALRHGWNTDVLHPTQPDEPSVADRALQL